ncbi:tripartite tricarboxylate transporter substrate binding protein [Polynucleobacter sp. JS-JIR-5-A7]|uniref:Bug family tripartite tricarboxylate transporter substrate binding protein n=1 Tax=Polynucleobacter sp. JS-JIR-5-A7 TaxID=1758395 RepID=UPI001BFEC031|nr:tripartite tricarboxylate transporter substrate binding protein [Polynucleobacter sp. JS-JIR-5-A7]QWE05755.1 tripartite tricarboxylate transporter substrate binding protein [Polynucleobacter sp. JS-JIR-5-A7]
MNTIYIAKRNLIQIVGLICFGFSAPLTYAQYPCPVIKIISPYPPGGASDVLARMLVPGLSKQLNVSVIVENKTGASGNIGTEFVSSATGDGCTLLLGNSTGVVINRNLYKLRNDPIVSLRPVAEVAAVPMVLYINSSVSANSVSELIALIKKEPGKYSFASPGSGSTHHLLGELLKLEQKLDMTHIPYRGSGPAIADVLAGQVPMAFESTGAMVPHLNSGKVRALATTGAVRAKNLPDVPTMKELGYPKFVVENWYGIFVPTKTPTPLVNTLNKEINKVLASAEVAESLSKMGSLNGEQSPEQFAAFIKKEIPYWELLVKQSGATAE